MEDTAESAAVEDLRPMQPEACVRRRLVQSTLFPISKKEQIRKGEDCTGEEQVGENDGEREEEEEEEERDGNGKKRMRNSSSKKKKKADNCNSKRTPRSRASKKVENLFFLFSSVIILNNLFALSFSSWNCNFFGHVTQIFKYMA